MTSVGTWAWPERHEVGAWSAGVKLWFLVQAPLPGMLGWAAGYALANPDAPDRRDALVMTVALLVSTAIAQALGWRSARRAGSPLARSARAVACGMGLCMAPMVFVMALTVLR